MLDLLLETVKHLPYLVLLPLYVLLVGRKIPLLVPQQLVDLLREQLDVLHHVPKVLRMHRHVGVGPLSKAVGRDASSPLPKLTLSVQVRHPHIVINKTVFNIG